ncbi:MAG: glucose/arabinose dehydrogenase [Chlamydiales bacterium]|jgi:glucose/arabinose dehydrogenase
MHTRRLTFRPVRALAGALLVIGAHAAPSGAGGAQTAQLVEISKGLGQPTDLAAPVGDARLFVSTVPGEIVVIEYGVRIPQPFLDLSAVVKPDQGLMSFAFHPDYASNRRFFVTYLDPNDEAWLVEYEASLDPNVADPASARVLIGPYPQLGGDHNWNCIRFGPDGMLYVATGDGGATHFDNDAQDLNTLNGKILRLDIDLPAPFVPADNPLVGTPGVREEIWAYGFRNPWRISFDDLTGDLYIADVGASEWEEINVIPAGAPGPLNFGWRCMEGPDCTSFGCCGAGSFVAPIHAFDHSAGRCAVIGGAVYNGSALPWLKGSYMFAEFCTGEVTSLVYDGNTVTTLRDHTDDFAVAGEPLARPVTSISTGGDGELYLIDRNGGHVFKVVPKATDSFCQGALNSAGHAARMDVDSSISVAANDFELTASDAIPNGVGLFFYGQHRVRLPFGDGYRCVGGITARLRPPVAVDASGSRTKVYDLTQPPRADVMVLPGATWHFQFWYRDGAAGGAGYNLSGGVSVTFRP